jgi:hypothetical protein
MREIPDQPFEGLREWGGNGRIEFTLDWDEVGVRCSILFEEGFVTEVETVKD